MELDFHYYAVYRLAELAGFSGRDAETIAYASQYVDDSTESEPVRPFPDQHFDTARTAHYDLEAFNWNVQKKIYMPFHFLPSAIRYTAPQTFSYVTQEANGSPDELSTMLVEEALKETDKRFRLVRLGVALHTVADTFSHSGFSGRHHNENNVGDIWFRKNKAWDLKFFLSHADMLVPRIGHVEAAKCPDQPFLHWKYRNHSGNLVQKNNLKICLDAANVIYCFLLKARGKAPGDLESDHKTDYRQIKSLLRRNGKLDNRCSAWRSHTKAPKYDEKTWRKTALKGDVDWNRMSRSHSASHLRMLEGKKGFDRSKWAFFHRAALKQRALVTGWLN